MLPSSRAASALTEQQLKQLRAQCIVFLAFKNKKEPKEIHLEIALGGCPARGGGDGGGAAGGESGTSPSSSSSQGSSSAGLPLPHLLPVSSLRLSSPETEQPRQG